MHVRQPGEIRFAAIQAVVWLSVLAVGQAVADVQTFRIPEGKASDTLADFGRQASLSLFSDPRVVSDQRTNAVSGNLEPIRALELMLKGSELTYVTIDRTTVVVKPKLSLKNIVHSLVGRGRASGSTDSQENSPPGGDDSMITVVGTRFRDDMQTPAGVFRHRIVVADLDNAGITTVPDLLRIMTENGGGQPTEEARGNGREEASNTGFGTGANLHGLGSAETLVLINGRRLAPSGSISSFTDISSIPLTAVDHVDFLADGTAPLYGADAIGGVVNFVLRGSDMTVPASQARVGVLTRGSSGEVQLSQSLGSQGPAGGAFLSFEYYEHDALYSSQRKQATSDFTIFGGPNLDTPAGNPGTIMDPLTGNLWGIPPAQNGVGLQSSDLKASQPNLYDRNAGATILPKQRRFNAVANVQGIVSDQVSLFFEGMFSHRLVEAQAAQLTAALTVPSTNAFYVSPTGGDSVDVLYGFGDDVGPLKTHGRVENAQVSTGVDYRMGDRWSLRAYVGHAFETQEMTEDGLVNLDAVNAALGLSDPSQAFNPFGAGSSNSPSMIASIRSPGHWRFDSAFSYANLSTQGQLFSLPAGPVVATTGIEFRRQRFDAQVSQESLPSSPTGVLKRGMRSIFTELDAPLIKGDPTPARVGRLSVSAGLRVEQFSGTGSVRAPQFGVSFVPTSSVTVYGNWARWFRPPNLPDMSETANLNEIFTVPDATAHDGISRILVESGGNSLLRPERAETMNFGVRFAPYEWPAFSASINYFHVGISDRISELSDLPLTVLDDPQYDWLLTRNYTDAQRAQLCSHGVFLGATADCLGAPVAAIVDMRLRNTSVLKTSGLDLRTRVGVDSGAAGQFVFDFNSAYFLRYAQVATPTSPIEDILNTPHEPLRFRFRSALEWTRRPFWISTALNYQGSYSDTSGVTSGTPRISSWTTVDLVLGVGLADQAEDPTPKTRISLSALNLLNSSPPVVFSSNGIAYDQENGTLLGRRVSVTLQHQW